MICKTCNTDTVETFGGKCLACFKKIHPGKADKIRTAEREYMRKATLHNEKKNELQNL